MYSAKYGGRSGRSKGKQATSKKKKHQTCTICGEKGHDAEDCPRMNTASRNSGGAGSGRSHKSSRRAGSATTATASSSDGAQPHPLLPPGFYASVDDWMAEETQTNESTIAVKPLPPVLFDAGCDVGETLDDIARSQSSKKKSAVSAYQALTTAVPHGGCLSRHLLKPNKPWNPESSERVATMRDAEEHCYFVVGLGGGYVPDVTEYEDDEEEEEENAPDAVNDDDDDAAVSALTQAIDHDAGLVVGVYVKLDYRPEVVQRTGHDRASQLWRFRATCRAALQANVPVQVRVEPGPSSSDPEMDGAMTGKDNDGGDDDTDDDPYKLVMKDLATVLVKMSPPQDETNITICPLRIHMVAWTGTATHMLKLLTAFDSLYVGLTAAAGFAKAVRSHECAFDVPLERLLLETDNILPSPVTMTMGRTAVGHSGSCLAWVAAAVAEHKKVFSGTEVAQAAVDNLTALYGGRVQARIHECATAFTEYVDEARKAQEELVAKEKETADAAAPLLETKQERKKKKKKKGKSDVNVAAAADNGASGADVELDFDKDFLASLEDN